MSTLDLAVSVGLLLVIVAGGLAFAIRVATLGQVHFARVDAQGSTLPFGRTLMELAYWVMTPVGRRLSRLGVTADAITATSLWVGAAAGVMASLGRFGVAAGLFACSALGDMLDGIVARESRTASDGGQVFDAAADRYTEFFFLGGLAIWYRENAALLALVLLALVGSFMVSYGTAKAEAMQISPPRTAMRRPERAACLVAGVTLAPLAVAAGQLRGWHVPADVPVVLALALVGVLANTAAVRRLSRIREIAAARERVRHGRAIPPIPVPRPEMTEVPSRRSSSTLRSAER